MFRLLARLRGVTKLRFPNLVARLFPEMLAPHGNTAKVKDADIQCAP